MSCTYEEHLHIKRGFCCHVVTFSLWHINELMNNFLQGAISKSISWIWAHRSCLSFPLYHFPVYDQNWIQLFQDHVLLWLAMSSSPKSWRSASSNLNFTSGMLAIHSNCTHLKSTSTALYCFVSPFLWASSNDFLISGLWMVLSTLPRNVGDSRFWTVSRGLQIRVWNLPNNHQSLPFLVDATLWQWNFKYFVLFELFY